MGKKAKKTRRKSGRSKFKAAAGAFFKGVFRILPFVLSASVAGGIFFGVRQVLYADPRLSIKEVAVYPPFALSRTRRQNLETNVLGRNIFSVDLKRLATNLQGNPEVQNARVTRSFPSSLSVYIKTRRPIALIQFSPKSAYGLISEDGMILDIMKEPDPSFVPVEAYGMGLNAPVIGKKIPGSAFPEVVRFLDAYWKHPVSKQEQLTRVFIDHTGNISITLGEGPNIRLGKRPAERLETLEKMMYLLDGEGRELIEYVDLQYDNVIVKRKNNEPKN